MQNPSSHESKLRKELEQLQASLAARLVYPERSIECSSFDRQELDRAAETLIRKRLSQTRSLLPESVKHLGKNYRRWFRVYAQSHHFDGHRAILLDAIHFADWMLVELKKSDGSSVQTQQDTRVLEDSLRWEQEICRLRLSRFRVRWLRTAHGVHLMVRAGKFLRVWKL